MKVETQKTVMIFFCIVLVWWYVSVKLAPQLVKVTDRRIREFMSVSEKLLNGDAPLKQFTP